MKGRFARLLACALPHLAIWAVMLFALAPQAQAVWECGGRACGSTAWTCCCNSGKLDCDQTCTAPVAASTKPSLQNIAVVTSAPSQCHCTMVSDSGPAKSLPGASASLAAPHTIVCILVPGVRFTCPRASAPVRRPDVRGPPLQTALLAFPSLRAPPVA